MRSIVLAVALSGAAFGCRGPRSAAPSPPPATVPEITATDLEHRLSIIAHDSMMGRETGSEGDFSAAEYIASEFRRLGLRPAGEHGTYFQTVPFWRIAVDPRSRISVGDSTLRIRRDFLPGNVRMRLRTLADLEPIYAGAVNDSSSWIAPSDARGRIAVFSYPPGVSIRAVGPPAGRFPGAAAFAIAALDQVSAEQAARLIEGRVYPDTNYNPNSVLLINLSREAASLLLGGPIATLRPGARGRPLTLSVGFTFDPVAFPARNVAAVLPGSDPALRGEYVALTAHNDHVGYDHFPVDHDSIRAFDRVIRPMGADSPPREPSGAEWNRIRSILDSLRGVHRPRLDSIRNGADDDGSGTVSILEIAEAMARGANRPRRSILFVSHTAEEAGLLGSAWFTDHPTVPLDSVIAEIDQDMVGRGLPTDFPRPNGPAASPTYLEVVGDQKLSLAFARALDAANARQPVPFEFDRSYAAPGHPLQYYCRADHYNYARYGIPAVALSRGEHLDYHQVTDEAQYISYPDLARVSKMVHDAALLLANADQRPVLDVPKPANPHAVCRQ
ncbi:MAG TPA: M28 family peptidase [Gemmatimonadaceae bacterium]|nr:M28 family peptidase [Gemmatimonadaceae bacterium]